MTNSVLNDTKRGRFVLGLLPMVLVPVAFLAALPWLKAAIGGPMASLVSAVVAIFVMGYANYFAFRHQRGLDEVQKASAAFAAQWGMPAGQFAFVLLLMLPPFKDLATSVVSGFAANSGMTVDQGVVVFAMILGFCGVVLLQTIGTVVVNAIWWLSRQ